MIEDIHYPAPQPENYIREEDPDFREDPKIYIEFEELLSLMKYSSPRYSFTFQDSSHSENAVLDQIFRSFVVPKISFGTRS